MPRVQQRNVRSRKRRSRPASSSDEATMDEENTNSARPRATTRIDAAERFQAANNVLLTEQPGSFSIDNDGCDRHGDNRDDPRFSEHSQGGICSAAIVLDHFTATGQTAYKTFVCTLCMKTFSTAVSCRRHIYLAKDAEDDDDAHAECPGALEKEERTPATLIRLGYIVNMSKEAMKSLTSPIPTQAESQMVGICQCQNSQSLSVRAFAQHCIHHNAVTAKFMPIDDSSLVHFELGIEALQQSTIPGPRLVTLMQTELLQPMPNTALRVSVMAFMAAMQESHDFSIPCGKFFQQIQTIVKQIDESPVESVADTDDAVLFDGPEVSLDVPLPVWNGDSATVPHVPVPNGSSTSVVSSTIVSSPVPVNHTHQTEVDRFLNASTPASLFASTTPAQTSHEKESGECTSTEDDTTTQNAVPSTCAEEKQPAPSKRRVSGMLGSPPFLGKFRFNCQPQKATNLAVGTLLVVAYGKEPTRQYFRGKVKKRFKNGSCIVYYPDSHMESKTPAKDVMSFCIIDQERYDSLVTAGPEGEIVNTK